MGRLIREFSGDLNPATQELAHETPVSSKTLSLRSFPSNVSMDQNLPPRPAMTPVSYSDNQRVHDEPTSQDAPVVMEVHMENKQAQLVEIQTRSDLTMNQATRSIADQNQAPRETVERDTTNGKFPKDKYSSRTS